MERFRGVDFDQSRAYGLVSAWFVAGWPDCAGEAAATGRVIPEAGRLLVQLDQVNGEAAVIGEPMAWDGSLTAPWGARVSPETITWMIEALRTELLPLRAAASFTVRGVAPRLPVTVRVDADALAAAAPGGLTAMVQQLTAGTVTVVTGAEQPPERLAEVLLDRLVAEPGAVGTQHWDLAQPFVTLRTVSVSRALRNQLAGVPIDEPTMIPAGVELPALDLGWRSLDVLSNLPTRRPGVIACGVNVLAPPTPPKRHQAAVAGCELTADAPRQRVTLRLAPDEPLSYLSEPWLILDGPTGAREVTGPQVQQTAKRLIVAPTDFGISFAQVRADPALLALAELEVTLTAGAWTGEPVLLDASAPEAAFVLPDDDLSQRGGEPALRLRVRAHGRSDWQVLPERPAAHLSIGLPAIPGWGPHRVAVTNAGTESVAVELADQAGSTSTIWPLAAGETRDWGWFATDPFRPGFRYRLRPTGEPGPWQGPATEATLTVGVAP